MAEKTVSPSKKKLGSIKVLLSGILVFIVFLVCFPLVSLVICGMIPTVVAYLIDNDRQRHLTICVGMCNFCGVLPYALEIIKDHMSVRTSLLIFHDMNAWLMMLAAAGIGWGLFLGVPRFIALSLKTIARIQVTKLKKKKELLLETWGEGILPVQATDHTKIGG